MQKETHTAFWTKGPAELLASVLHTVPGGTWVVAVSGGADSLFLAAMLRTYLAQYRSSGTDNLCAVMCDHGLRSEAVTEAHHVAQVMRAWRIPHQTLRLRLPSGTSQAGARKARHAALATLCHAQGARTLFLGHQASDQAETFLMRLAAGSHAYGLGGLLPVSFAHGLRLCRPLLNFSRAWVRGAAQRLALPFIDDPSNDKRCFQRVRVRQACEQSNEVTCAFVYHAARHYGQRRFEAQQKALLFLHRNRLCAPCGTLWLPWSACAALSPEVRFAMLAHVLQRVGGTTLRPLTHVKLEHLWRGLIEKRMQTVRGCQVRLRKGVLTFVREWQRVQPMHLPTEGPQPLFWDDRWLVELSPTAWKPGRMLHALGRWRGACRLSPYLKAMPGLFEGDHFIAPFWDRTAFKRCIAQRPPP
jgi:tRNA(Ile)-lysidine synthase